MDTQIPQNIISINTSTLKNNWLILNDLCESSTCAAVLKADAYGLGTEQVAPALYEVGVRHFYVAQLHEAIALRRNSNIGTDARISVLQGLLPNSAQIYKKYRLSPVVADLDQLSELQLTDYRTTGWAIQLDTGMGRLGIRVDACDQLVSALQSYSIGTDQLTLLSHLASSEDKLNPQNIDQISLLRSCIKKIKPNKTSLSNSGGIILTEQAHFDEVRPGCLLYGLSPNSDGKLPDGIKNPITVTSSLLQVKSLSKSDTVGYNATFKAPHDMAIGIVNIGYADGFHRRGSNSSFLYVKDKPCRVLGRVSMDLIAIDLSAFNNPSVLTGCEVEIIGKNQSADILAKSWGTIGYEVLTSLGNRFKRCYTS